MKKALKMLALIVGLSAIGIGIGAAVSGATAGYSVFTNLQILTNADVANSGNLRIGNGTPTTTLNGEDAYIEGTFEVDGASRFDGAVTFTSSVTGITAGGFSGDITLQNGEIVSNATDAVVSVTADDDAVEWFDFQIKSSNTGEADNDYLQISWWGFNDTGAYEYAQDILTATDVTTATEDSVRAWSVATAGTMAKELNLSGAALYPNADGGLDLGIATTNQFGAAYVDTLKVGVGTPGLTLGDQDAYVQGTFEVDGTAQFDGGIQNTLTEDYITTTSANVLTAAEMWGKVFTMTEASDDPVTHNLPTAVQGMTAYFIDLDATAAADLILEPQNADTINGSVAGVNWQQTGDVAQGGCYLYAYAAGKWALFPMGGTWAEGS